MPYSQKAVNNFLSKFDILDQNDCWIWIGARGKNGYGRVYNGTKTMLAHRFSYEIFVGEILPSMVICHSCDNPACVNPHHLFMGTMKDNMRDSVNKNRFVFNYGKIDNRGEKHGLHKLSNDDILEIQRFYSERKYNQPELAELYGVTQSCVSRVVTGKRWRHIGGFSGAL